MDHKVIIFTVESCDPIPRNSPLTCPSRQSAFICTTTRNVISIRNSRIAGQRIFSRSYAPPSSRLQFIIISFFFCSFVRLDVDAQWWRSAYDYRVITFYEGYLATKDLPLYPPDVGRSTAAENTHDVLTRNRQEMTEENLTSLSSGIAVIYNNNEGLWIVAAAAAEKNTKQHV